MTDISDRDVRNLQEIAFSEKLRNQALTSHFRLPSCQQLEWMEKRCVEAVCALKLTIKLINNLL